MTGKGLFQMFVHPAFSRGPGKMLLGILLLCIPIFVSFSDFSPSFSAWHIPEASRDISSAIQNPLTEVARQADLPGCLHDSVPEAGHDFSWECAHGKPSAFSAPAPPPVLPSEGGLFALPNFSWVPRTDQDFSPGDEPSLASPPPRSFPA